MTFEEQRARMVQEQLQARGISDRRALEAFLSVPRHLFVPKELEGDAYTDHPISIGHGQTISQPYMVALMTQLLRLQGHERILEIGTGSGYQTAILAELALEVYSVERISPLAEAALKRLERLGCLNVHLSLGNGSLGWPEHAPYDGVLVAAAATDVPQPLLDQMADGGRLVLPIGGQDTQTLTLVEKHGSRIELRPITSCVFVPLISGHGQSS